MRNRRKTAHCRNCNLQHHNQMFNYCPQCGQENTDNHVPLSTLFSDLFNNYLTFNSRFARSVAPFFLQPGKMTNTFIGGKRLWYMNPVRLYLIMSVFYFFSFKNLINNGYVSDLTLDKISDNNVKNGAKVKADTIYPGSFAAFIQMIQDKNTTTQIVIDTLSLEKWTMGNKNTASDKYLREVTARQLLKIGRSDLPMFISNAIDNIPAMMLIILPLLALYMKILYIRSDRLYIEHMVFLLYFHCFVYFVFGIGLLLLNLKAYAVEIFICTNTIILVYHLVMTRQVYQQSWRKSFLKIILFTSLYIYTLSLFPALEFLVSFYTF